MAICEICPAVRRAAWLDPRFPLAAARCTRHRRARSLAPLALSMIRYARRLRVLAACMAALAGFVDAIGYLQLDGYFVSFMSGNSTRLSVGLSHDGHVVAVGATLVALFVAGVALGTVATRVFTTHRPTVVLGLVAILLAAGACCGLAGSSALAVACMTLAMGAENVAFERDGEVSVGLTYMTGTLVKVGQRLVTAFTGGDRWAWAWHLSLWLGLVIGAAIGAAVHPALGLQALWIAAADAVALAVVAEVAMPWASMSQGLARQADV
jgi:uncharacterized membrane protein YoaK (UPF0700 family)